MVRSLRRLAWMGVLGLALWGCGSGDNPFPEPPPGPGPGPQPGTRTLTGRVVDLNGRPVAGAQVAVQGTNLFAITNANGDFTLTNVPATTVTLVISAAGSSMTVSAPSGTSTLGTIAFISPTQGPPPPPVFP